MTPRWLAWFALTAIAACLLPWVVNPGAGLSLNAVDLAEWTSLSPAVQAQTPALWTSFLLRTPLWVTTLLAVLAARGRALGWVTLLIVALSAAQLPPIEFFGALDNANYRQQFLMAVLTAGGGLLAVTFSRRINPLIGGALVAVIGLVAVMAGASGAAAAMQAFGLPAPAGPGLLVYGAALAFIAVAAAAGIKKRRATTPPSESIQAGSD